MEIENDTLKVSSVFNSGELECLVIFHPEHQHDYFKFVVVLGGREVILATTGTSKQMKKHAIADGNKQWRQGRSTSEKIGNMIGCAIWLIGKSKLEQTQAYYDALLETIGTVLELK